MLWLGTRLRMLGTIRAKTTLGAPVDLGATSVMLLLVYTGGAREI